jgi:rfaE bifunctional protein kinase chain/domain
LFSGLSVLVIGDHCLDRDCIGEYSGFSREKESLPIFRIKKVDYKPGGAGNLAANFAALGVKTKIAGVWGNDGDWDRVILENRLKNADIDTSGMVTGARTPTFEKYYFPSGKHMWRTDVVSEDLSEKAEANLLKALESSLKDVQFVVVADYDETGKGVCTPKILEMISSCGITKFGTSRERITRFRNFHYLVMNRKELGGENIHKQSEWLLQKTESDVAVITLAGKGSDAFCYSQHGNLERKETLTKELTGDIDSCGCGDTFMAVFSSGIMSGYDLEESMRIANSGARAVARKLYGAHCTSFDEIGDEYEELYLAE